MQRLRAGRAGCCEGFRVVGALQCLKLHSQGHGGSQAPTRLSLFSPLPRTCSGFGGDVRAAMGPTPKAGRLRLGRPSRATGSARSAFSGMCG